MKKINITSLLLCAAFCSSCGTNSGAFVTTSTENQALTTPADLNDEDRDAQQLYDKAVSIKDKLNSSDEPYGVSAVYYATDFDFNNDSKYDHLFAFKLYYQFQFVVLDGFTYETIINERIMMDFSPDNTLCEIYHDENGNKAERFVSSIQKTAASGIAETVQIIKNDEAHIFEAVYDKDTHEFAHAYDKYDSYDKYIDGQFKLLEDYPYVDNIIWTEYIADETKPAENTTVTDSEEVTEKAVVVDGIIGTTEIQNINYLLRRFKNFSYNYLACKSVKECISEEYIEIEKYSEYLGETYKEKWYKITDGEITSLTQLYDELKGICTENMIDTLGIENYYCEKEGCLYLSENAGNDGGVLGVDEIYIKSIDHPDETTLVLNMHAYGNGEYWELDEDFREDFTVTLKKYGDEFLIDECGLSGISYITWIFDTFVVTASEESSVEKTAEIPVPLAEYNVRDYFHAETMSKGNGYIYHLGSKFLTEEQLISFWLTYHFHFMFEIETSYFFDFSSIDFGERNADFYSTGFTYESVMNSLKTFMSEEIIKEITSDKCADIDGEFYCGIGAKGARADFDDHIEFTPVEITDEKVIFQITARYANPDNPEEKSYYTYDYEMVLDGENWIMTKFELWR